MSEVGGEGGELFFGLFSAVSGQGQGEVGGGLCPCEQPDLDSDGGLPRSGRRRGGGW
ncbi:hypothetical protein [Streptomyces asiaticus]|uniref:hypothetical protein n=1 Tax=Streptomyces asiaticus TaxID=114695 RepID=UPI003F663AE4